MIKKDFPKRSNYLGIVCDLARICGPARFLACMSTTATWMRGMSMSTATSTPTTT